MANFVESEIEIKIEEENERYKCGEVFMEYREESLIFSCTLCDSAFTELDLFIKHLYEELDSKKTTKNVEQNEDDEEFIDEIEQKAEDEPVVEEEENRNHLLEPMHTMFIPEGINDDIEEKEVDIVMVSESVEPIQFSNKDAKKHRKQVSSLLSETNADDDKGLAKKPRKNARQSSYTCSICGKVFARREYLKNHTYTHAAEKPFPCDFCGARFANKTNLVVHRRQHTGETPYACEFCPSRFKSSTERKVHTRYHTGEKPYICEICGRGHATASFLLEHRRRHLKERNYECETCSRAFTTSSGLHDHINSIHKDAPRDKKCDVCGATFKTIATLNTHKQLHTGKKFFCIVCEKGFAQKVGLYSHMKTHDIVKEKFTLKTLDIVKERVEMDE